MQSCSSSSLSESWLRLSGLSFADGVFRSPYDTGDRCFIDDENLVVKKMGLFATIFTRADGTETYYFNSMLFNKFM